MVSLQKIAVIFITVYGIAGCASTQPRVKTQKPVFVTQQTQQANYEQVLCVENDCQRPTVKTLDAPELFMAHPVIQRAAAGQPSEVKENKPDGVFTVHFPFGSSKLGKKEKHRLLTNLSGLKAATKIVLSGRTDSVGGKGINDKLSKNRAVAVRNFLKTNGVENSNIHTDGEGLCCYLNGNSSAAERAENRRAEVKVIFD